VVKFSRSLIHRRPDPLPASFVFGVGTADHQCEAFDPRCPDVWDTWEAVHSQHRVRGESWTPRGRATDFWQRFPEDIQLAQALGCSAFRFSIAWARVEPRPGQFSNDALAHYRELASIVRSAGMEPVVTLMHLVWPQHVEERGGLRAPDFPAWFGEYAARVRDALGDLARYWLTINEPDTLILGYMKPWWTPEYLWPPGLEDGADEAESMRATAEVVRNLFRAHRAARLAVRAGPGGEQRLVSANSYYLGLPNRMWRLPFPLVRLVDWLARSTRAWSEEDWVLRQGRIVVRPPSDRRELLRPALTSDAGLALAPRQLGYLVEEVETLSFLFSFLASNWWQLGLRGDLPTFLCPPECRGQLDYVAFDYYYGTPFVHRIGRLLDVFERRYDHAPIWAHGLYGALHYFQSMFPRLPVFVVENGVAGRAGDRKRGRYISNHVRQVQRAREDGVNVSGYLVWSLTTNREWGLPAGPSGDFGLYHIDLEGDPSLTRHPTPAAAAYAELLRQRGV